MSRCGTCPDAVVLMVNIQECQLYYAFACKIAVLTKYCVSTDEIILTTSFNICYDNNKIIIFQMSLCVLIYVEIKYTKLSVPVYDTAV